MSRSCEASEKPAPERVQRLQHLEALVGGFAQRLADGDGEVGVGARLGAADAAAQLIELGEAEHFGAMHDQRVGVGQVEAGFDDGGRQQHVVLAVVEGGHDVFQLARRQLAGGARERQLRHRLAQEVGDLVEVGDARGDVEALAAAVALAAQRVADDHRIERRDVGAHGEAIDRRRGDQRQLAHAGQRQLQRARDGRRRQREHVHVLAHLLQPLLVGDAEVLLLVDDQQAEALEVDRLAEQRVRADDDVDGAVGQPFLHLGQLLGADEARGLRDA